MTKDGAPGGTGPPAGIGALGGDGAPAGMGAPGSPGAPAGIGAPGAEADRTGLAWTRSALNMGAIGLLISRAAFGAGLETLGVACAVGLAMVALFTVRRARFADEAEAEVGNRGDPRPESLGLLTAVTVLIAVLAIVVTVAI